MTPPATFFIPLGQQICRRWCKLLRYACSFRKTLRRFSLLSFIVWLALSGGGWSIAAAQSPADTLFLQRDIFDLIEQSRLRRVPAKADSTRPKKRRWTVMPGLGYTVQNGFSVSLSGNIAYRASTMPTQNPSIIAGSISATQRNQFTISSTHNIWSRANRTIFNGDYRFWIYPQETFGLGGSSRLSDANLLDYRFVRISQFVYRQVVGSWYAGGGYILNHNFRIREAGHSGSTPSDFLRYDPRPSTVSSGLAVAVLRDRRRRQLNPVAGGEFVNVQYLQNLRWLGSTYNWRSLVVDTRKYLGIGRQNKLALWALGWFTFNGRVPYLDLPSTAWDAANNTGRGYVQGRFRGKNMLYAEAEYRATFTRDGLLGGVLFVNAQSFTDWPSNRFTRIHPAAGLGLRIRLNKRTGANIAIDYAIGADGSRGFFVNLGEVF